jgi:hypothetical protein
LSARRRTHGQVNCNGGALHDAITSSSSATIDGRDFTFL